MTPDAQMASLSPADLALLFDVPEPVLLAAAPLSSVPWTPPAEWMRTARRRAREAMAATNSTDLTTCINHLRGLK